MESKEDAATQKFDEDVSRAFDEKSPDYLAHVNIALVGKVSSGKSSLLNAFFERDNKEPLAEVGASSGITTKITPYKLDDHVLIVDCPGLDDVRKENTQVTKDFLDSIDLGIFVVTGSADASQKSKYDDLKSSAGEVFVVLNKMDEWDELEEAALEDVKEQWRNVLGLERIFPLCTKGYDPRRRSDAPMDIRGVGDLRSAVFDFLKSKKKDILLAKHLKNKSKYAAGIVGAALLAVSVESFVPGSAAYITATQAVAISSLYYLYTGEVLSKKSALGMLPTFVAQSAGRNLFLWAKSFLPPTGVVDAAAAIVAVVVTFATLGSVAWMLREGKSLDDKDALKSAFSKFSEVGEKNLKGVSLDDFKDRAKIGALVLRLMG